MALPKVVFEKMDINENLDTLAWYAMPKNSENSPLDYYKFTLRLFPELKGKITEKQSYEEVRAILETEIKPILEKVSEKSQDTQKFAKIWNEVNDDIMRDLEVALDMKWPKDYTITCRVGLLPVCPRDIVGRTFDINYGTKEDQLIETCIHEICHFLYFEKWKKLYPNYTEEEFDNPHIAWYLSEAMIDPLLNNERFKKYTNEEVLSYTYFYETLIEGESVIEILRKYVKNYSIDEAIRRAYDLFRKYENLIKK